MYQFPLDDIILFCYGLTASSDMIPAYYNMKNYIPISFSEQTVDVNSNSTKSNKMSGLWNTDLDVSLSLSISVDAWNLTLSLSYIDWLAFLLPTTDFLSVLEK